MGFWEGFNDFVKGAASALDIGGTIPITPPAERLAELGIFADDTEALRSDWDSVLKDLAPPEGNHGESTT